MKIQKTAIVLFCDDFRIKDNPALYHATENYQNIIPLYIYNSHYLGRSLGESAKIFLHNVLISFCSLLKKEYQIELIIQKGNYVDVVQAIKEKCEIDAIYFNDSYTASQIDIQNQIKNKFKDLDIKTFKAKLLFSPWEIKPSSNIPFYKVFTPFAKECLQSINLIQTQYPKPQIIKSLHNIQSLKIEDLKLMPTQKNDLHSNLINYWNFDHSIIETKFINFSNDKLKSYKDDRNIPSKNGTSFISPYLRFGMISPKMCFNIISEIHDISNQFIMELLWREFSYHVMFYNQNIATEELKHEYKNFKWNSNDVWFQKWKKGETGFDIVDAGMIELLHTGIVHNRVRMVTASFLIKDLLIDWRLGEQWFWEKLVDADPAINPFAWQWVFGSGFDAAPYFRIFNPESQKEKFDPNGTYCSKWLPDNWKSEKIVNHSIQRQITLERYKNC